MSGLWLHLRNSPIRLAVPALIALDLAVLFLRNRHWVGVWPETGAAAQVPAYLLGAVVAGAAAWAASAPARHGLDEQLQAARVHPARVEAYQLSATAIIMLLPYLVGQAVAFVATARTCPPGVHLWLGYTSLGAFVILLAVTLGWVCGKLLGPIFAGLTAALGFLFLTALLDRWVGFIVTSGPPEMAISSSGLIFRFGTLAAILLAMLWLLNHRIKGRRRALLLLPLIIPLILAIAATDPVIERNPPASAVTCIGESPALCIWPEHEKYRPLLREISARIKLLPDNFVRPERIEEFGLQTWHADFSKEPGETPYFYILEGSPWSYAGGIGKAISGATLDPRSCDWSQLSEEDLGHLRAVDKWLEAYLAGGSTPDYETNAPEEMQEAWAEGLAITADRPLSEQFEWAANHVSELHERYCQSRS